MSNHIHILLSAQKEQVSSFFSLFKQKMGLLFKNKSNKSVVDALQYSLFPVGDRKCFCQEVAYIVRNPFRAGISSPFSYRWSSGWVYFNPYLASGKEKKYFTVTELRAILKTRYVLPDTLRLVDGIIAPSSFLDIAFVERLFEQSSIFFFNLVKTWNLEDVVHSNHGENVVEPYSDEEALGKILDICKKDFHASSLESLDRKDLARLARQVRSRFGCSKSQLLRLLPVDDFFLDRAL